MLLNLIILEFNKFVNPNLLKYKKIMCIKTSLFILFDVNAFYQSFTIKRYTVYGGVFEGDLWKRYSRLFIIFSCTNIHLGAIGFN